MPKRNNSSEAANINTSSASVFSILRHISTADRPLGVADLHRMTGEPTSSTHRALMTLEEASFASRHGSGAKFGPGPMAYHVIRALISRFPVRNNGMRLAKRIAGITDAAVTLNTRIGWYSLRVGWAEGRHEFFEQRRIGEARLLHTDVAPLSMLIHLSNERLVDYREYVTRNITDPEGQDLAHALDQKLPEAREHGFAVRSDPLREERSWVAVPLLGPAREAGASIAFALRDSDLPSDSVSAVFDEIRVEIEEFQALIDRDPSHIATPFDHLDPDEIELDLRWTQEIVPGEQT